MRNADLNILLPLNRRLKEGLVDETRQETQLAENIIKVVLRIMNSLETSNKLYSKI